MLDSSREFALRRLWPPMNAAASCADNAAPSFRCTSTITPPMRSVPLTAASTLDYGSPINFAKAQKAGVDVDGTGSSPHVQVKKLAMPQSKSTKADNLKMYPRTEFKPLPKYIVRNISLIEEFEIKIPQIQVGELYEGWIDRIRAINGLNCLWQTFQFLQAKTASVALGKSEFNLSYYGTGAFIASLSEKRFTESHTTLDFERALGHEQRSWQDHLQARFSVDPTRLRQVMSQTKICQICVESDIKGFGFSYLRKDHALPGVFWCAQHRCGLQWAYGNNKGKEVTQIRCLDRCSEPLKRYVELAIDASSGNLCVSHRDLHAKVVLRMHAKHLMSEGDTAWNLEDFVAREFSDDWIKAVSDLQVSGPQSLEEFVPGRWKGKWLSTQNYLLALAVLFNDTAEAKAWAVKPMDKQWIDATLRSQHLSALWWQPHRLTLYQENACSRLGHETGSQQAAFNDSGVLASLGLPSVKDEEPAVVAAVALYGTRNISVAAACKKLKAQERAAHALIKKAGSSFFQSIASQITQIEYQRKRKVLADEAAYIVRRQTFMAGHPDSMTT